MRSQYHGEDYYNYIRNKLPLVLYPSFLLSLFKVLVCNYGPGGNEAGGSMYKVGKPGSLCPKGSNKGLCI